MPKAMNAAEREWVGMVRSVRCVLCVFCGFVQRGRTYAHHMKEGAGLSQRSQHWLVVALCYEHHQGATGIEGLGTKGFYLRYKIEEVDLLAMTIAAVFERLRLVVSGGPLRLVVPARG